MASFNGKWALCGGENLEAFHDAIKTTAEYKEKMKQLGAAIKADPNAHIQELNVDTGAGVAKRTMFFKGEKKHEGEVPIGKDHTTTTPDGRTVTVKLTVDSPTKITRCEKGDGWEAVGVFEVSGSEMTLTQTAGSVKCTMKFRKV